MCWIANFFLNLPGKQAERPSGWLAIKNFENVTLQERTPLLTHCTNPFVNQKIFQGLDHSPRNSGVNLGILHGAEVAQAEIARGGRRSKCPEM